MTRPSVQAAVLLSALASCASPSWREVAPTDPSVRLVGRTESVSGGTRFEWPGAGARIAFEGTSCKARLRSNGAVLMVEVDGSPRPDLRLLEPVDDTLVELVAGLPAGHHLVEIGKRTEGFVGSVVLRGFLVDGKTGALPTPPGRRVEFVGNSITCGYGVLDSAKEHRFSPLTENVYSSWAFVAGRALDAEVRTTCFSGRGLVRNADGSVEGVVPELFERTSPVSASEPWDFSGWRPQAVVLNLGTNDFARYPPPDSAAWEAAVVAFVARVRKAYGPVPVVLADGPMLSDHWPNKPDGKPFPSLATVRAHLENAARKLQGVSVLHLTPNAAERGFGADWHPNRAQAELNGRELSAHLSGILGWTPKGRRR